VKFENKMNPSFASGTLPLYSEATQRLERTGFLAVSGSPARPSYHGATGSQLERRAEGDSPSAAGSRASRCASGDHTVQDKCGVRADVSACRKCLGRRTGDRPGLSVCRWATGRPRECVMSLLRGDVLFFFFTCGSSPGQRSAAARVPPCTRPPSSVEETRVPKPNG
jgi:hypothetical protein